MSFSCLPRHRQGGAFSHPVIFLSATAQAGRSVYPFCHYGAPPIVISRSIATRNLADSIVLRFLPPIKIGGRKFTSLCFWLVYQPVFLAGLPACVFGWFTSL
ncbi:MAG: hypothetical protein JXA35_02215, partial [Deltaproteobacteria bacterium]|nr:hypothetical protein [Deltaproteobacteria bacterium]